MGKESIRGAFITQDPEGRYDIINALVRMYFDRGHKHSLQAAAGHAIDQYRKDAIHLRTLLDYVKADIKENPCDHSVGICACSLIAAVNHLERIFPLPLKTPFE